MATKKSAGGRVKTKDSPGKHRGMKIYAGSLVKSGNIIHEFGAGNIIPGKNSYFSKTYSVHAKIDGIVSFRKISRKRKTRPGHVVKHAVDIIPQNSKSDVTVN